MATGRVIAIHTSDMGLYKACRRRWLWGSHLNRGLESKYKAPPLWFGEAFHSALKDWHGPRLFPTVEDSFYDYVKLSYEHHRDRLPVDADELVHLGYGMFGHYNRWLERRDELVTYEYQDRLQVESSFEIELPIDPNLLARLNTDKVVYRGTFDRVVIDQWGHLWILDYKTAKRLDTAHLPLDPQITRYMWAGSLIYDRPVVGFIYQQHLKKAPKPARVLKSGHISVDKSQATTHALYRQALVHTYGDDHNRWSQDHIDTLNKFAYAESWEGDPFIRRTKIERNHSQLRNEFQKILLEVHEMLDPDTPMYPHQSWTCAMMCPFFSPCNSLDDGSDWEYELNDRDIYVHRQRASSEWELLSFDRLGGVLYNAKAEANIEHDRAGRACIISDGM